jgi:uncharacterized protein YxeA
MEDETGLRSIKFDMAINLGQVLTLVSMLFTVIAAYFAIKGTINDHEGRIVRLEQSFVRSAVDSERTTTQLNNISTVVAIIRDRQERDIKDRQHQ